MKPKIHILRGGFKWQTSAISDNHAGIDDDFLRVEQVSINRLLRQMIWMLYFCSHKIRDQSKISEKDLPSIPAVPPCRPTPRA